MLACLPVRMHVLMEGAVILSQKSLLLVEKS